MRALIVDHSTEHGIRLGEVEEPVAASHEAIVRMTATTLNYAEVAYGIPLAPEGSVLGADGVGIVEQAAPDGTGPQAGTLVLSFARAGAWAELRAIGTDSLAPAPISCDPGELATLAMAGLSALRSLRLLGPLLGQRVLVTGASGGVGHLTVQLASLGGAHVIASTRSKETAWLRGLGIDEIVTDLSDINGTVGGVIDLVGGQQLVDAFSKLAPFGTLVSVGHSTGQPSSFPIGALVGNLGNARSITTFFLAAEQEFTADLAWLAKQMKAGILRPTIGWRGDWSRVPEAIAALHEGSISGKAVIDIS